MGVHDAARRHREGLPEQEFLKHGIVTGISQSEDPNFQRVDLELEYFSDISEDSVRPSEMIYLPTRMTLVIGDKLSITTSVGG